MTKYNKLTKSVNLILAITMVLYVFGGLTMPAKIAKADSDAPTKLTAQAISDISVELTWEDNSTNEIGFEVRLGTTAKSLKRVDQVPPERTGTLIEKLTKDTSYYFQVATCNIKNICTSVSEVISTKTPSGPINIQSKALAGVGSTNINLGWLSKTPVVGEAYWTDISDDGHYAYVTSTTGLQIIDITNPASPLVKSTIDAPFPYDVTSAGNYVYFGSAKTLKIVDVSDPLKPVITSTLDMPDYVMGVFVSGNIAYLACYSIGLAVIDITSPYAPTISSTIDTPGYSNSVAVSVNTAVIADSDTVRIIDVTNPALPVERSHIAPDNPNQVTSKLTDVAIANNVAYVTASQLGLFAIGISNLDSPQAIGLGAPPNQFGYAAGVAITNNKAYVAVVSYLSTGNGLQIFDITDPAHLVPTVEPIPPSTERILEVQGRTRGGIAIFGNTVAFCSGSASLAVIDVTSSVNPIKRSQTAQTTQSRGLVADQHYLYTLSYSSIQSSLKIFNKDDPKNLKQIGNLNLDEAPYDIMLGNDGYAYISDNKKLKIVNITNPANPQVVGTYLAPNIIQGVFIANNKVYLACYQSGLEIVNVATKSAPTKLGGLDTPGVAFSVAVSGNTAVVADSDTVRIINVANPALPVERSHIAPNNPNQVQSTLIDVAIANNVAYVTASLLGVFAIGISNPDSPQAIGLGAPPTQFGYASGIAIANNKAYVAVPSHLSTDNDIQVFDISNPLIAPQNLGYLSPPVEVGAFQTRVVAVSGRYIYLSDEKKLAHVFDTYYDQLKVENTASVATINHGQEITYTLKITNPTPYTLNELNLSNPIPESTNYVEDSASNGGVLNENKIDWSLGSIAPNEVKEVSFRVWVN